MNDDSGFNLLVHGIIDGPDFSPRALQKMTGLVFDSQHEKGEPFTQKSYQGSYGWGSATLTAAANALGERNRAFDIILDSLITHQEAVKSCGGTSVGIWVAILESGQGNWAATPGQIQKLAAVNGSLAVTYYQ